MTAIDHSFFNCSAGSCPGFNLEYPVSHKDSFYAGALGAWVAEMDYPIAQPIREVVARNLNASLLAYIDTTTHQQVRAACAYWLKQRHSWEIQPSDVFCTGDIIAGFEAVMRTLTSPDAPIIVPTPAYHLLLKTPRYFNRRVIEVPCTVNESGRYLLDYEAIDAVLQPGALFVLTNPYNPVGQAFLEDELRRLAALVSAHDALVFADEVHSPLILSETVAHIPYASISEQTAEHTVTAISASKAFNITGLKAAQLIICGEALKAKWKPYAPFYADAASRLGLAAAVAAYTDSRSLIWLEQIIATLQSNHRFLRQHFAHNHPEVTISSNDATYLAWIDVRPLHLGQRPAEFFLKHASVAVNDGTSFGAPGFIRLNFALEPDKLKRVCSQMTRALKMREAMSASLQSIRHVDAGKLLDCVGL